MIAEFATQAGLAYAFVEREVALMKRYWLWELVWIIYGIVTSLSVAFIGIAAPAISGNQVDPATTSRFVLYLLVGTIAWRFMGLVFENIAEIIAWERWEGTIEYTFMAPIRRITHLLGMCAASLIYGIARAALIGLALVFLFKLDLSHANYWAALAIFAAATLPLLGLGIFTSILPLLSPEKGEQMAFAVQGVLLLISGVYYPITVLPGPLHLAGILSPLTYTLDGVREALLHDLSLTGALPDVGILLLMGIVLVPASVWCFGRAEVRAKRLGLLKRSG